MTTFQPRFNRGQQHSKYNEYRMRITSAINRWVQKNVHKPIQGFEHKKNTDGTDYNYEQQLRATHCQLYAIAHYFMSRGKSYEEIITVLRLFR